MNGHDLSLCQPFEWDKVSIYCKACNFLLCVYNLSMSLKRQHLNKTLIWYRKKFGFNGGVDAIKSGLTPLSHIVFNKTGLCGIYITHSILFFIEWILGFCRNLNVRFKEGQNSYYGLITVCNQSQPKIIHHYKLDSWLSIKTLKDKAMGKIYLIGV